MNHTKSSANGISSSGLKMSLACSVFMCGALFRANKETDLDAEVSELPVHFFIIGSCWLVMSGTWILWNPEARFFVYRKFNRMKQKIFELKLKKMKKVKKSKENGVGAASCSSCRSNDTCPNCIAKSVLHNRLNTRDSESADVFDDILPGALNI